MDADNKARERVWETIFSDVVDQDQRADNQAAWEVYCGSDNE